MFTLANSDGRFIMLRCIECSQAAYFEKDKFEKITPECVILKDNINITCEKCGAVQPKDKKIITLEPQNAAPNYDSSTKSDLPYWLTRDISSEEMMRAVIFK